MKINFKKPNTKDVLWVKIDPKYLNEVVKENGVKTLYLKREENMTLRKLFLLARKVIALAKGAKAEKIAVDFRDFSTRQDLVTTRQDLTTVTEEELAEILGTEFCFADYEFTEYKSKKESTSVKEVFVLGADKNLEKYFIKGLAVAEEVNKTRTLANTPGGDMTPKILAGKAREAVKGLPVKVTAFGEREMAKQKMNAILSVGRGSDEESQFIIMEYWGGPKSEKPIVLVGKGVTFDAGGINLKPSSSLTGMNMDMSGGAAVIHTVALVAKMKLKKNVIALIPSVENFVSGKSYRPGDVIRSMSGATIEILNTDAEGRVILADALSYAQKYKPKVVIDIATLTGAAAVALGERMSALFSDDDELCKKLEKIGDKTSDYMWRLPMWEEHENEIKGKVGDWTNVRSDDSRYGGATYGAIFLKQFTKGYSWVHIDIASRMTSMSGEYLAPGALGTPVRLLYKFIEERE